MSKQLMKNMGDLFGEGLDFDAEVECSKKPIQENINFKNVLGKQSFQSGTDIYNTLDNLSEDAWNDYINVMKSRGIKVDYDVPSDVFTVESTLGEEELIVEGIPFEAKVLVREVTGKLSTLQEVLQKYYERSAGGIESAEYADFIEATKVLEEKINLLPTK